MADKYITQVSGVLTEKSANTVSAGAGDAGKLVALDASGKIDSSMMPTGISGDTLSILASETLTAGDWVNVWNNTGTANVRRADAATPGKDADGFVLAGVSSGAAATVYFEGTNNGVTTQTPGKVYLSAANPGKGVSSPPTTAGQFVQRLGVATSATTVNFESTPPITLA